MNQVTFPRNQTRRFLNASARFGAYIVTVAAVEILFYRFSFSSYASLWIPPLLAEPALFSNQFRDWPYWKGLVARLASLVLARMVVHYTYVIPVVYRGAEAWSEEVLWAGIVVASQVAVAAIALIASRRLLRMRQPAAF